MTHDRTSGCPYGSRDCDSRKTSGYWCKPCLIAELACVTKRLQVTRAEADELRERLTMAERWMARQ